MSEWQTQGLQIAANMIMGHSTTCLASKAFHPIGGMLQLQRAKAQLHVGYTDSFFSPTFIRGKELYCHIVKATLSKRLNVI